MKKSISIILSILCILMLVGCNKKEQIVPDTPNAMVPSIVYEGNLYRTTGKQIPAEVDESAIVGEISSVVPLTQLPAKEGEANFGEIGNQYAITSKGLLVKMNNEWTLFELSEKGAVSREMMLSMNEFWKSVTAVVYYDFNEDKYQASDITQLQELQVIFENLTYKEIENPWLEGWYMFEIHTNQNTYHLGVSEKTISFDEKFYEVSESISEKVLEIIKSERNTDEEVISYNGKEYKKSELCNATLQWLELSEQEKMLSSYMPPEFMVFEETWGIALTTENVTPGSATIKCTQSGGEPTGELHTGSWYILENWTQENGWREMPYVIDGEIGWSSEAWMIPMNDTCEWEVNWEWLYGTIPDGKYRIGKEITDFRASGDYDNAIYFVEFSIDKDELISFHDKTFNKSDLSEETIEWLENYNSLSEEEQLAISSIPADFYGLCGYPKASDMPAG